MQIPVPPFLVFRDPGQTARYGKDSRNGLLPRQPGEGRGNGHRWRNGGDDPRVPVTRLPCCLEDHLIGGFEEISPFKPRVPKSTRILLVDLDHHFWFSPNKLSSILASFSNPRYRSIIYIFIFWNTEPLRIRTRMAVRACKASIVHLGLTTPSAIQRDISDLDLASASPSGNTTCLETRSVAREVRTCLSTPCPVRNLCNC